MNQSAILILAALAVWLLNSKSAATRRWGCICGLASEPFWLWTSYRAGQWGIFTLCVFYCFAYARGWWNNRVDNLSSCPPADAQAGACRSPGQR